MQKSIKRQRSKQLLMENIPFKQSENVPSKVQGHSPDITASSFQIRKSFSIFERMKAEPGEKPKRAKAQASKENNPFTAEKEKGVFLRRQQTMLIRPPKLLTRENEERKKVKKQKYPKIRKSNAWKNEVTRQSISSENSRSMLCQSNCATIPFKTPRKDTF